MEKIIWSVELSPYYDDDTFNGTFDECVEYCRDMEYIIGKDCRLAKILVNKVNENINLRMKTLTLKLNKCLVDTLQ